MRACVSALRVCCVGTIGIVGVEQSAYSLCRVPPGCVPASSLRMLENRSQRSMGRREGGGGHTCAASSSVCILAVVSNPFMFQFD